MGVDYYTQLVISLTWKDSENKEHSEEYEDGEREGHYRWGVEDSDFDKPVDELARTCENYGKHVYFDGTKWLCQPCGIERIRAICSMQNIPFDKLTYVYKFMSGWYR